MEIINHTNPGHLPVNGDWIEIKDGNSSIKREHSDPYVKTAEEVAQEARHWRNAELSATDWISQTPDHPERAAYLTYRTKLRDWPSTSDFPDTKPTL
jgi:hypothetical protein|tara:strand:+ start:116 stop:406 length:291 start_codon:yes stop_codon:yes gene_type:complete